MKGRRIGETAGVDGSVRSTECLIPSGVASISTKARRLRRFSIPTTRYAAM
jgi:hypothetical protein